MIEYGLAGGLAGFYLTGSTGEGMMMSVKERKQVYRRAAKAAKGKAKVSSITDKTGSLLDCVGYN